MFGDRYANEKDDDLRGMESNYSQLLKEDAIRYGCYNCYKALHKFCGLYSITYLLCSFFVPLISFSYDNHHYTLCRVSKQWPMGFMWPVWAQK